MFGNPAECFQRYHTAQILLHSLSQHVSHSQDRALLIKCNLYIFFIVEYIFLFLIKILKCIYFILDKDAVEKRLYVLQQQGYIYATDPT